MECPSYLLKPEKIAEALAALEDPNIDELGFQVTWTNFIKNIGILSGEWFPVPRIIIPVGNLFYKARTSSQIFKEINTIADIGINKINPSYGRCNLVKQPVFYAGSNLACAISEVVDWQTRGTLDLTPVDIAIGYWKNTKEISLCCLIFENYSPLLKNYCYPLEEKIADFPPLAVISTMMIYDFFAKHFKTQKACNQSSINYRITNVIAQLMYGLGTDGILYQSTAALKPSINIAVKEQTMDAKKFHCEQVIKCSVSPPVKRNRKYSFGEKQISILQRGYPSFDDRIDWK